MTESVGSDADWKAGGLGMSQPVTENLGLTWESRLALWMPRPPLFGTVLIAAGLVGAYLGFQWYFEMPIYRLPIFVMLMIAYMLMVPRLFAYRQALDRKRYGLDVPAFRPARDGNMDPQSSPRQDPT